MSSTGQSTAGTRSELPKKIFGYDVVDFIGEGAGSIIYVVSHPDTRQLYALKHVVKKVEKDVRYIEQLENEYQVTRNFIHPGLRRAIEMKDNHSFFHKATEAILVMELFDGATLETHKPAGVLQIVDIFIKVAEALHAMHESGYVHCDLKPNNILISNANEVKVIDYGQACKAGTVKERIQGTPDYIAPEQVKRDPVTIKTDIFNFGATLYWAVAGRTIPTLYNLKRSENSFLLDQAIPTPAQVNSAVPENLSNLIMECVRSNPAKRPPDMSDLIRRLEIVRHVLNKAAAAAPTP